MVSEYCNIVMALTKDHIQVMGPSLFSTLYWGIFNLLNNLEDGYIMYNTIYGPIRFLIDVPSFSSIF